MERVKTLRVYNLVNANGEKLRLSLGFTVDDYGRPCNGNSCWRWSFVGKNIPMPVRSRTWFCGFPEPIMISWLKGNGWFPRTRVELCDGYAEVFELPAANDAAHTENEETNSWDIDAFHNVIRELVKNGKRVTAVRVYRYAHGGTLRMANDAVMEIVDGQN
jgi:hypothetical protein